MRRSAAGIVLLVALVGMHAMPTMAAEVAFQTGFHYDWWRSDDGSVGEQILVPYLTECSVQDFSLKILGGYAWTRSRLEFPEGTALFRAVGSRDHVTSVVSGVLDTKVNLSYDPSERLPFGLLLGLDFNLPTGQTKFRDSKDTFLVLDPDLVSVSSLGEGFNINPNIVLTKEWNDQWTTGVGFGYAWRGDYKRYLFPQVLLGGGTVILGDPRLNDIDPGDVLSVAPEVRYYLNEAWTVRLFFNYSHFGSQEVEGRDVFQPGDHYLAGVGLSHSAGKWASHATLSAIFRGDPSVGSENVLGVGSSALTTVNPFAEGNEVVAELGTGYSFDDKTTLQSQLAFRYLYDANLPESVSETQFYVDQRKLVSLQLALIRKLIPHLDAEVSLKGLYMHDDETLVLRQSVFRREGRDELERDFAGISVGFKLTGTF